MRTLSLRTAADLVHRRAGARLAGRRSRTLADYALVHTLAGGTADAGPRARPPRRSRSSSSALTAAASSTSTPHSRSRTRRPFQQLRRAAAHRPDSRRRSPPPTGAWWAAAARAGRSSPRCCDLRVGVIAVDLSPPSSTARRRSAPRASRPVASRARPAETWRARNSATGSCDRRSGRHHDGDLERLGQLRRWSPSRDWAVRCRCPISASSEVVFGGVGTGLYSMLAVRPAWRSSSAA